MKERWLVARTDKLGDVLLALPTLAYLRGALGSTPIDFLCPSPLHELLAPFADRHGLTLTGALDRWDYRAALFLFAPGRTLAEAWWRGIPLRGGVKSKLKSLTLNAGVWQRRSRGERPEALYNLELAGALLRKANLPTPPTTNPETILPPNVVAAEEAEKVLKALEIDGPFTVVHPGSGGSGNNLSPEGFGALVRKRWTGPLLLSSGPSPLDAPMVAGVAAANPQATVLPPVRLAVLGEVFRRAERVVAPGTGPLHLAHFVGTPVVGIFSPNPSERASRWAPWGGRGSVTPLTPAVECPARRQCLGARCPLHPCLETLV